MAAVTAVLAKTGSTKVLIVGHSLGAAIALLDAVYLPLHLPSSITFTTNVFGLPRVGNPDFANYGTKVSLGYSRSFVDQVLPNS